MKIYYYYNLFILLKFWFNLYISTVIKEIYLFQLIEDSDPHITKDYTLNIEEIFEY